MGFVVPVKYALLYGRLNYEPKSKQLVTQLVIVIMSLQYLILAYLNYISLPLCI